MTEVAPPGTRRTKRSLWMLIPAVGLVLAAGSAARRWLSGREPRTSTWVSDGAELGARVRAGELNGVTHHRFQSTKLGRDVGLVVATPPGYAQSPERRHAVVYFFHGLGSDEWSYLQQIGLESPGVQALFAVPEQAPILVFGNAGDTGGFGVAEQVLAEELVGFVDRHYRTKPEPRFRSLEGFSLGGVTALTLATHRPDVFGRAVAFSSACYLIEACDALRAALRAKASTLNAGTVMLVYGQREIADNRAVSEDLAPRFGTKVVELAGIDHDWGAQLAADVDGVPFGRTVAAFHLAGFAP